jgi:hypothetical protein
MVARVSGGGLLTLSSLSCVRFAPTYRSFANRLITSKYGKRMKEKMTALSLSRFDVHLTTKDNEMLGAPRSGSVTIGGWNNRPTRETTRCWKVSPDPTHTRSAKHKNIKMCSSRWMIRVLFPTTGFYFVEKKVGLSLLYKEKIPCDGAHNQADGMQSRRRKKGFFFPSSSFPPKSQIEF